MERLYTRIYCCVLLIAWICSLPSLISCLESIILTPDRFFAKSGILSASGFIIEDNSVVKDMLRKIEHSVKKLGKNPAREKSSPVDSGTSEDGGNSLGYEWDVLAGIYGSDQSELEKFKSKLLKQISWERGETMEQGSSKWREFEQTWLLAWNEGVFCEAWLKPPVWMQVDVGVQVLTSRLEVEDVRDCVKQAEIEMAKERLVHDKITTNLGPSSMFLKGMHGCDYDEDKTKPHPLRIMVCFRYLGEEPLSSLTLTRLVEEVWNKIPKVAVRFANTEILAFHKDLRMMLVVTQRNLVVPLEYLNFEAISPLFTFPLQTLFQHNDHHLNIPKFSSEIQEQISGFKRYTVALTHLKPSSDPTLNVSPIFHPIPQHPIGIVVQN